MSLRTRMVLVAGVAVAIAALAVAVASYAGTRSELQGQVDQQLQGLVKQPLANIRVGPGGQGSPLPQSGPHQPSQVEDGGDPDEGLGLDRLPAQAFGGPSGAFTVSASEANRPPAGAGCD